MTFWMLEKSGESLDVFEAAVEEEDEETAGDECANLPP
jgi:hypothetical protein